MTQRYNLWKKENLQSKHPKKDNIKTITKLGKEIRENIRRDRKAKSLQTLDNRKHIVKTGGVKKALKELRASNREWIPKLNKKESSNSKTINEKDTKFYQDHYYSYSENKQKHDRK